MLKGFSPSRAVLPCIFIAALGCLVVPLPGWVLDLFLVSNLLFALFLFIASLQISHPLKLSTLPTLLLLATLIRLCLNITTTRAILTTGHAGQTVQVFGQVVIQGNIIVGLILFALVTLVQFLVVAKGAERVAEVGARFTLDALPGKQMAIDAELRGGLIDGDLARKKRSDLQCESRFYGALDGAMKFVKGDAIAGIVIVLVNILGGFLVGVFSKGLTFSQALTTYTTLSIGDGLLSQIPSFLNAVAAGLVVTRVQGEEESALGSEVISQLRHLKEARLLLAVGALLLGLVPGMPWPLLLLMSTFCISSLVIPRSEPTKDNVASRFSPGRASLVEIRIPKEHIKLLGDIALIPEVLEKFRETIFRESGLLLPRLELPLQPDVKKDISVFLRGMWLEDISVKDSEVKDIQMLLKNMRTLVERNASELVDDIMTRQLLELLERDYPDVVAAIIPTLCTTTQLTLLLKALVADGISIYQMDVILQAIAESDGRGNMRTVLCVVRSALKRAITSRLAPSLRFEAHVLDPLIDSTVSEAERAATPLSSSLIEPLLQEIRENACQYIITSQRTRLSLSEILVASGSSARVVAFDDLLPEVKIIGLGMLGSEKSISTDTVLERSAA